MLFRKTQVIFNNGLTLDCQKICFRTDEYVVVFTNNDTYEVYNKFGENISPEGCTHIEKGIKNQLIIRFETKESSISQVYYFQNGVLHPITFYRPSTPDIPLVCNFIFVIGGWERKKAFFRYVLCIYNKNGEEVIGLGTEDGGEVWLDLIYTDFQVTEAGFIVINSENMFGFIDFERKQILPFEYTNINYLDNLLIVSKELLINKEIKIPRIRAFNLPIENKSIKIPKIGAFDLNGKEILPIEYTHINVTNNIIVADKLNIETKERFFYLYTLEGTSLYTDRCVLYKFVKGTSFIIITRKDKNNNEFMGVIDLEAKNELIPIQHKNITIENDYFIVYENFGEKNKVVLILKFNKTIILYLKDGYDKINFMEKYIVAEADNNVIVVDYNGKILAKFTS